MMIDQYDEMHYPPDVYLSKLPLTYTNKNRKYFQNPTKMWFPAKNSIATL